MSYVQWKVYYKKQSNSFKTKKHILSLNKNNSNNTGNLTCIEERANELREEFEIIQKILDKLVRNLSDSEIDIVAKIRTGNTRAVPITSHSQPTPPILTHSPKPSDPPRPVISLEGIRDAKKSLRKHNDSIDMCSS